MRRETSESYLKMKGVRLVLSICVRIQRISGSYVQHQFSNLRIKHGLNRVALKNDIFISPFELNVLRVPSKGWIVVGHNQLSPLSLSESAAAVPPGEPKLSQ
ncbi:PREDICTED: uncharacterized protein LOC101290890 [Fragaria vesca subsp. vesca]|uniref:uncharacterized protein LOC101290890 n=1 Tax=Fragaria vesca subsp. vesca TaxID=101020 RepID=UPI0002C3465D|nr:PREDICTED: uncharacterized protein LOC101290890 [Fragaria vesca subsp. vesca]